MTGVDARALERFRAAITRRLGLSFDESRLPSLHEVLQRRSSATPGGVEGLLARVEGPLAWRDELRALAPELTIAETYFFRNPDHFRALLGVALPARLLARPPGAALRLLSAGCASGEEAYSLGIALRGALEPGREVSICGIDLNPKVLEKAARARYSRWALRGTPAEVRSLWFRAEGHDFVLDASVRAMVAFEERNLTEDDPAFWQRGRYDVIFCRNVLMYLTPEVARAVIARLAEALAPGGFLFLGHAETLRGMSEQFHLRNTHDAFYYQRRAEADPLEDAPDPPPVAPSPSPGWADSWLETVRGASERIAALADAARAAEAPRTREPAGEGAHADLVRAIELMGQARLVEAQSLLGSLTAESRADPDVRLLHAVLLMHGGDLAEAARVAAELLETDDTHAGAHYVTALCCESAGDARGAERHDQLAARLDPSFAMPRLHLGLLARRAGDGARARGEFTEALRLLDHEDAHRVLLFGGGFSREALTAVCRGELAAGGGAP